MYSCDPTRCFALKHRHKPRRPALYVFFAALRFHCIPTIAAEATASSRGTTWYAAMNASSCASVAMAMWCSAHSGFS